MNRLFNPRPRSEYLDIDKPTFPVITRERQQAFEAQATPADKEHIPCICGYYGRACWQMGDPEGANRALCMGCPLAAFCETH